VIAPELKKRVVWRPGTEWTCGPTDCNSRVQGRRGFDVIWQPLKANCSSPRVLYIHGGSWLFGSPVTSGYAPFASKLSAIMDAMVMVPDYPLLSPLANTSRKSNYSIILEHSLRALQWLTVNGPQDDCPADFPAPVFIGGDSSGGGTALSLAIMTAMQPDITPRALAGAFFFSPWTNLKCNTPEYYFNAFSAIIDNTALLSWGVPGNLAYVGDIIFQSLPRENENMFLRNALAYLGSNSSLMEDPIISPYYASDAELRGLPPLFFATGSSESILGDTVTVAQKAAANGVDVQLELYPGMWHVFPMYSEGCGGRKPLWNAVHALNRTGLFVRHIAQTGRPPYRFNLEGPYGAAANGKQPYTSINYHPKVGPTAAQASAASQVFTQTKAIEQHVPPVQSGMAMQLESK